MFLGALSFLYFAKALSGSYLKSSITQIERRFEIPSSLVGVIDGSFEIGNLLVIIVVSYFGAKLHRPKIIAAGCLIMSAGTFFIAMPHFFMARYSYGKALLHSSNYTSNLSPCLQMISDVEMSADICPLEASSSWVSGCDADVESSLWVYVLLGNLLRGIGEAPIQPLGISYLDDYSREEDSAFYIGCVQTAAVVGPIFGFLLGSLCARLFVDFGAVDLDQVAITPEDAQWIGAWWLGYLVAGAVSSLATIPFWFLPNEQNQTEVRKNSSTASERSVFILEEVSGRKTQMLKMAKEFLPSLRDVLGNPVYFLYVCGSVFQYNSLIGMVTYKPKYIEQQYGQTSSTTNFIIGLINVPAVALGIFSGGVIMKKFRVDILGAAQLLLGSSVVGYLMLLSLFALGCENSSVAGLTVSYQGFPPVLDPEAADSGCNLSCFCPGNQWDPVCGENGVTYFSACFAGCRSSNGTGRMTTFSNCSCVAPRVWPPVGGSAVPGPCAKGLYCSKKLLYFVIVSVVTSFALSFGGTPGYILLLRCTKRELKPLALGIYTMAVRVLAGVPAPVYFGALIDSVCLKWSNRKCRGKGACRLYNTDGFRYVYLGVTAALGSAFIFLNAVVVFMLRKRRIATNKRVTGGACQRLANQSVGGKSHLTQPAYSSQEETQL
ncbi:solute carrier organic anion transporter family member 1C1-like [Spea bombifrons]|uniref:solute carrier organic anion transporter family member 1C1-like n=1 Tax=Spea bombifrons TaxID=233779 RepID=UPI00234942E1|nr:solute carrier organic anion transporter family member 1C1-like [Spea bombifrons]